MTEKEMIQGQYESYITLLEQASESISTIKGKYTKFSAIQHYYIDVLDSLVNESKQQMRQVLGGTVWDKLVIAFFGVTNAGKSTIIETFRILFKDKMREAQLKDSHGEGVDGLIVGDGRLDFTQYCQEYDLEINGKPFVLIDVPGIEGKESDYIDEITTALKKAHCIFYIQGENQKPDDLIAQKIQKYLSDWVEVYSVWNLRGAISDYDEEDERVQLKSHKDEETENSIKEVMQNTVGDVYKGNVTIQALLALTAVARFHPSLTDRISVQDQLLRYFGSAENALEFSQFSQLVSLVDEKCDNFTGNIVRSNQQKLLGLKNRIQSKLAECVTEKEEETEGFSNQLRLFKHGINNEFSSACNAIHDGFRSMAIRNMNNLLKGVYGVIDGGGNKEERAKKVDALVDKAEKALETGAQTTVDEALMRLKEGLETKRKDLDQLNHFSQIVLPESDYSLNLDVTEILSGMEFDFLRDGLKQVVVSFVTAFGLVVGGAAIGGLFGGIGAPIGAGVGALTAVLKSIFVKGNDGRDKARKAAQECVYNSRTKVMEKLETEFSKIRHQLDRWKKKYVEPIDKDISNMEALTSELSDIKALFDF